MSSSATGEADGVETSDWKEWDALWSRLDASGKARAAMLQALFESTLGLSSQSLDSVAVPVIGAAAIDRVRCIHEQHSGPGYRPEWAHRTAGIRGSLQNAEEIWFDRKTHLWHRGPVPSGVSSANPEEAQVEQADEELPPWDADKP